MPLVNCKTFIPLYEAYIYKGAGKNNVAKGTLCKVKYTNSCDFAIPKPEAI
jgi:hypothetical protein